jgi:hypothetical protein
LTFYRGCDFCFKLNEELAPTPILDSPPLDGD